MAARERPGPAGHRGCQHQYFNRVHGEIGLNLGFAAYVGADATFTFAKTDFNGILRSADEVHAIALANFQGEYASVLSSAEIKGQLLNPS
jgi:hypothetical protein